MFLVALLTPPGRFLVGLYRTVQAGGTVGAEMPVAALKLWFALVPALAFGPSAVLLIAWLRARGVSGRNVTG